MLKRTKGLGLFYNCKFRWIFGLVYSSLNSTKLSLLTEVTLVKKVAVSLKVYLKSAN